MGRRKGEGQEIPTLTFQRQRTDGVKGGGKSKTGALDTRLPRTSDARTRFEKGGGWGEDQSYKVVRTPGIKKLQKKGGIMCHSAKWNERYQKEPVHTSTVVS